MKRKIAITFTETVTYDVEVAFPAGLPESCTQEQLIALIEEGSFDWLENVNQAHTVYELIECGEVEHREMLSCEIVKEI